MNLVLDVQRAAGTVADPGDTKLADWVTQVLTNTDVSWQRSDADDVMAEVRHGARLTIRLVEREESALLNQRYRHLEGPTNILSFPFGQPQLLQPPLLGDLVICVPLLEDEARQQHKPVEAHWTHLVIHGLLHLFGYDHVSEDDAEKMEALEIQILQHLGISDPYQVDKAAPE